MLALRLFAPSFARVYARLTRAESELTEAANACLHSALEQSCGEGPVSIRCRCAAQEQNVQSSHDDPAKAQQQEGEEESVLVCVRVRPAGGADGEAGWTVDQTTITQAAGKHCGERYRFDAVCGTDVHTEQVYERSCREVVGGLLVGRSGTIVAYGQTASGKTHTTQGVMRLACEQVFDEGTAEGGVRVWASYLEVYDEKLTDLLDARSSVQVKDKPVVRVTGAHEVRIGSPNALDAVVNRGERNRKRGATRLNAKSSRSHAVLRLRVETDVRGVRFEATLCVVDLAGSEKPKRRKSGEHSQNGQRAWVSAPETRFHEGVGINKSLSALNHVLRQMGDRLKPSFRNATLTRLLQPTLQGRAKLALICCVAPGTAQLEETRRTLQFGRRAARASIRIVPNTVVPRKVIRRRPRGPSAWRGRTCSWQGPSRPRPPNWKRRLDASRRWKSWR